MLNISKRRCSYRGLQKRKAIILVIMKYGPYSGHRMIEEVQNMMIIMIFLKNN